MDVIERAARAVMAACEESGLAHSEGLAATRAVLLALRDPPGDVLRAGESVQISATCEECPFHEYDLGDKAREVWQAMIDAALGPNR